MPVDDYTIEHILPQNTPLSADWQAALGPEWETIQKTWLHTLGNLTLTGYNSEYSDRPFVEKRDMEGGFKASPLKVNDGLGQIAQWNEEAIRRRAVRLADQAVTVWAAPKLDPTTLVQYRPERSPGIAYTIDDHPQLQAPLCRTLFESFRKAVLALDPCVSEEFLKLYVAYKAETNFVDVIPQSKRLRLMLNMRVNEVHDPEGICIDVRGKGRWGNGDVEVFFSSLEQLPYILGLVRQSLELQLGDGATG